jgi:hypothetical protein
MSLKYIRDYYGVPAEEGVRIRYTGDPSGTVDGTITGTNGPHLLVKFDDAPGNSVLHPKWEVEYLTDEVTA